MSIAPDRKTELIKDYAVADGDTGSPEVQVAILTERIRNLTEHLKEQEGPSFRTRPDDHGRPAAQVARLSQAQERRTVRHADPASRTQALARYPLAWDRLGGRGNVPAGSRGNMRLWERKRDRFRDRCRSAGPKLDGGPPDGGRRWTAGRWGPSERKWKICLPYIVRS